MNQEVMVPLPVNELVQKYDEPILKYLQDIKIFHIEFSDYFTNKVLAKTYKMKSKPDKADYFCFEAPKIVDCDESSTDWKRGRDY
ncbi:hypothetical protein QTO34_018465, partial [Cnephaeus nilssonii]